MIGLIELARACGRYPIVVIQEQAASVTQRVLLFSTKGIMMPVEADLVHIVGVIDGDGNEALYVNGVRYPIDGWMINYVDIVQATGGRMCVLSHIDIDNVLLEERDGMMHIAWPDKFEDLMPYVVKGLE